MKKYNGYDELSDRKEMRNWAGSKKFHDDNEKRIAELEKEKADRDKKKSTNFTMTKKNVTGKYKMNESQLREFISNVIKESLNADYMKILQKNGFQPMQAEDDLSWVDNPEGYFISVLTSLGWFHSKVYRCNEGTMFRIAEKLTDALEKYGWVEEALNTARSMGRTSEYTDIAYIEGVFQGDYDDNGNYIDSGVNSDTCGAFAVDETGYGFWND